MSPLTQLICRCVIRERDFSCYTPNIGRPRSGNLMLRRLMATFALIHGLYFGLLALIGGFIGGIGFRIGTGDARQSYWCLAAGSLNELLTLPRRRSSVATSHATKKHARRHRRMRLRHHHFQKRQESMRSRCE